MELSYDRFSYCIATRDCRLEKEWSLPIMSVCMPPGIKQVEGAQRWHRKRVTETMIVLETWRIIEAA